MPSRGFTLLEIVLAVGLTGAVMALLATAIELYIVRVDTSRSRVESAQLARSLLGMIAGDLKDSRYFSPASQTGADTGSSGPSAPGSNSINYAADTLGIYGNETELHIDRGGSRRWERVTEQTSMPSPTQPGEMPQRVRYYLGEGDEVLAGQLAAAGVGVDLLRGDYAGLYRSQNIASQESLPLASAGFEDQRETGELLAPEVVDIRFAYFDGDVLVKQWDSAQNQGLPRAVEIKLTLLQEPLETAAARGRDERQELREKKENLKEYRLLVQLPRVRPARTARGPRGNQEATQPTPPTQPPR